MAKYSSSGRFRSDDPSYPQSSSSSSRVTRTTGRGGVSANHPIHDFTPRSFARAALAGSTLGLSEVARAAYKTIRGR
jgi:hypothetical protein